jgi:nitrogen fixation NifU-like protein
MSIYQEHILDHYHNPRRYGILNQPTHSSDTKNISCGDSLHMDICVSNDTIQNIGWTGQGCAISQASASMLAEYAKGKTIMGIKSLAPKDLLKLLGLELSPNRLKCALLSLETLHKALKNKL